MTSLCERLGWGLKMLSVVRVRVAEGFSVTGICSNPSFVPSEGFDERARRFRQARWNRGARERQKVFNTTQKPSGQATFSLSWVWFSRGSVLKVFGRVQVLRPVWSVPGSSDWNVFFVGLGKTVNHPKHNLFMVQASECYTRPLYKSYIRVVLLSLDDEFFPIVFGLAVWCGRFPTFFRMSKITLQRWCNDMSTVCRRIWALFVVDSCFVSSEEFLVSLLFVHSNELIFNHIWCSYLDYD